MLRPWTFAALVSALPLAGCGGGGAAPSSVSTQSTGEEVVVAVPAAAYGTVRSDGLPQPLLQVGDEGASLLADRAIVSFDIRGFPPANHIVAARLWSESRGVYDDFGAALGPVGVLRIDAGTSLDGSDFGSTALSGVLDAAPPPPYGFALVLDVTEALRVALDHGADHLDLRLQAAALYDGDDVPDLLRLEHRAEPGLGNYPPELVITARR